jgi:hypothetical protein
LAAPRRNPRMLDKRWEYEVEKVAGGVIPLELLNEYGSRGWELVSVIPDLPMHAHLVFKREVPPDYSFLQQTFGVAKGDGEDGA